MRTIFAWVVVLAALAGVARAADEFPTISTTGTAVVYVVPDKVIVTLGVQTSDGSLDTAKRVNESAAVKLVKAIKDLGIEQSDIGTDRLDVSLRYRDNRTSLDIEAYVVRRAYAVTLKDPKLLEKLVDTALRNGANQIDDVQFQSTELRKYRDQARAMAIHAAKEKAVDLAKELDCTVGKPRTIGESSGSYGYWRGNRMGLAFQNGAQVVPGEADSGETLPLGKIAIEATVNVTFDLKS
jgi:uncharacterized protein YggE